MNYVNVSMGVVITKIFRDLGIRGAHWVDDAVEWGAEALEQIGAFSQLEKKVALINIQNFKGPLPIDLIQLLGAFTGHSGKTVDDLIDGFKIPIHQNGSTFSESLYPSMYSALTDSANCISMYDINNGFIHGSNASETIAISYLAMPVSDEDGFPLVPNKIEYREALMWYIMSKLIMSGRWKHPSSGIDYLFAYNMWQKYCTQARNSANMFDIPSAERFLNNWVVNLPRDRFAESFGSNIGYAVETYGSTAANALGANNGTSDLSANSDLFDNNSIRIYSDKVTIAAGESILVNLDYSVEGFSVSYENAIDLPYISAVTNAFGGYTGSITFLDADTYTIKAVVTNTVSGAEVTSLNTLTITVT